MTFEDLKSQLTVYYGLEIRHTEYNTQIRDGKITVAIVSETQSFEVTTYSLHSYTNPERLYSIVSNYAQTPLEERRPQPHYHWVPRNYDTDDVLNVCGDDEWHMDNIHQTRIYQTEFTKEEYKQLVESDIIPDWFDPRAI